MFKSRFRSVLGLLIVLCMVNLLFVMAPQNVAFAGDTTYYVDSVNGNDSNIGTSTASPWRSLSKVNGITFSPGDKILLKAGSVWNDTQLYPKGSGSSGSPIVIDMYGSGNKPIINANRTAFAGVYLENQEYWEINNLEVTNYVGSYGANPTGVYAGIHFRINKVNAVFSHIYVSNCYVHDVDGDIHAWPGTGFGKSYGGISCFVIATDSTDLGRFDDVQIKNNSITRVVKTGIQAAASKTAEALGDPANYTSNVVISGNDISYAAGDGIIISHVNTATVSNNLITYACSRNQNEASAGAWPWHCTNIVFQGNECAYTQNQGTDCCAWDFDLGNQNITYQYNYSHNNAGGQLLIMPGIAYNAIFRYNISANEIVNSASTASGGSNTWFYNNICYNDTGRNYANYVFNNIYYNCYNLSYRTTGTIVHDYNCYYGGTTFSEANGVNANPLFSGSAPGDGISSCSGLTLQASSPCINAGIGIGSNGGNDFFGNTLYTGSPDIGAYESAVTGGPVSNNLALYKTTTASTVKSEDLASANATDGNTYTRWASEWSDPQWIYADLGENFVVNEVKLSWEIAYGKSYNIQVSNDAANWTTVYSTTTGDGGIDDITFAATSARYVRMYGTARGTAYGYSLCEFEVYGPAVTTVNDTSSSISYANGTWNTFTQPGAYNNDIHNTTVNGAEAAFTFTGSYINFISKKGPGGGIFRIYIDGNLVKTFDSYSASEVFQVSAYENNSLTNGSHTIQIVNTNTKNPLSTGYYAHVDYFRYY